MHRSKTEWVLNPDNETIGWVWNPITGCLNNCSYCYARKLAKGRLKERYLANRNLAPARYVGDINWGLKNPFYPRFWPERLQFVATKPRGVFVCDMSDLFGIGIPEEWTEQVLKEIAIHPRHRFYLLTKQPQNLVKWSFSDNCWVGVSASNQDMFDEAVRYLSEVDATIRYVSFEPLLSEVKQLCSDRYGNHWLGDFIDWVIIGAQTRPLVLPQREWVEEIIEAADRVHIPVFLKDSLKPMFPEGLKQEMPEEGR